MATTANKTKAATTPRIGSTKEVKVAEVAKPTTAVRKGIELVAKVEVPKKAKAVAAKPRKAATKKDSVGAISQPAVVSREWIEHLAYRVGHCVATSMETRYRIGYGRAGVAGTGFLDWKQFRGEPAFRSPRPCKLGAPETRIGCFCARIVDG